MGSFTGEQRAAFSWWELGRDSHPTPAIHNLVLGAAEPGDSLSLPLTYSRGQLLWSHWVEIRSPRECDGWHVTSTHKCHLLPSAAPTPRSSVPDHQMPQSGPSLAPACHPSGVSLPGSVLEGDSQYSPQPRGRNSSHLQASDPP